ncbi:MAG: FxLYD domain-containing protein [Anaerolineae bacterium]
MRRLLLAALLSIMAVLLAGSRNALAQSPIDGLLLGVETPGGTSTSFTVVATRHREATLGSDTYYVVEGVIQNTGTRNVTDVYVRARLYFAGDNLRAESTDRSDLRIMKPGETSSFSVWVKYPVPSLIDYYRVDAVGIETDEQPYRGVATINELWSIDGSEQILRGELSNIGNRTVDGGDPFRNVPFAYLFTVLYDSQGQVIDYNVASLSFDYMNPGQKQAFAVRTSLFNQVARWEHWIQYEVTPPGLYGVHVSVSNVVTSPGSSNTLTVRGQVTNQSDVTLSSYHIYVVFRDAQGRVINFARNLQWPLDNPFDPGETQSFATTVLSWDLAPSYAALDVYVISDKATTLTTPLPPTATYTATPRPSATATATATRTATPTPTQTPTPYPSPIGGWPFNLNLPLVASEAAYYNLPTPLPPATKTATPTITPTATDTLSPTPTASSTDTPTITTTPTVTLTPTITMTPTSTFTPSITPTSSSTATATLTPTATQTPTPSPTAMVAFYDRVESGTNGWIVDHDLGGKDWVITTNSYHSSTHSWYGQGSAGRADLYMISPPIFIQSGVLLAFWHQYSFDDSGYSPSGGAVLEVSTDDGSTWSDMGQYMTRNGYNSNSGMSSAGNPVGNNRPIFSGNSDVWLDTRVNLAAFVNQTLRFRFRVGMARSAYSPGWWVDDIYVGPLNLLPHSSHEVIRE